MANTQGFEVVAEVTVDVLRNILRAAWKSGGDDSDVGVIPEHIELSGLSFPPGSPDAYVVKDGTVQIPQDELGLEMAPDINGVEVKLGTIVHLEIDNPPVPAATFFDLTVDLLVDAPIRSIDDNESIGVVWQDLPDDAVTATITSGNPFTPIIDAAVEEFVHAKYQENGAAFPHEIEDIPINVVAYTMLAMIEFFDDESDPARRITVSSPQPDKIEVRVPCHIRFYDIEGDVFGVTLDSPMGVEGDMVILADYVQTDSVVRAELSSGVVTLEDVAPADPVLFPNEGANYTANRNKILLAGPDLQQIIETQFSAVATSVLQGLGDIEVNIPTVADLEQMIAEIIRDELESREQIQIWKPEPVEDGTTTINNVTPKALSDAMAIGINAGDGANPDGLVNFIPDDRDFATAVTRSIVIEALNQARDDEFGSLPTTLAEPVDGHDVILRSLNFNLTPGAIHLDGSVTVEDAILGSIDVDADFSADVGLEWQDAPDGAEGQRIVPFVIGDPDVDLSLLAWILSFLIGFITLGIVGGIIGLVVIAVAEGLASRIGSAVVRDEFADEFQGIDAWPGTLDNIGSIDASFLNPIIINSDCIVVSGQLLISSSFELTLIDMADSQGPYFMAAGAPVGFNGGIDLDDTDAFWDFGDGNSALIRQPAHTYGDSGLYVAKLRINVEQLGGAATRHFARVQLRNIPPTVNLGPNIALEEGQEFEIIGTFTDPEWLDTHVAWFDFGDNTKPVQGTLIETNAPPQAQGEVRATHAYCDNGIYTITLSVHDDDGGVGRASIQAVVSNVPPQVTVPERVCALVGQPVRLIAQFTDNGWCDSHTGTWDFGDCTIQDAVIYSTHEPPQAAGTVEATHVYTKCGDYRARIMVADDDGGVGEAVLLVRVVELQNAHFEKGFRIIQRDGVTDFVINEWYPYIDDIQPLDPKALRDPRSVSFKYEEFVYRDGRRAQRVDITGAVQAGIYQSLCSNRGWDYEFSAHYHLPEPATGMARIGIDPTGGTNPASSNVVWKMAPNKDEWRSLTVRATAAADTVTLFFGVIGVKGGANSMYLDRAHVFAIQPLCTEPEPLCKDECIDFSMFNEDSVFQEPFVLDNFTFSPLQLPLETVTYGEPAGQVKLGFNRSGVRIDFPFILSEVSLTITNESIPEIQIQSFDENGVVLQSLTESITNETRTITLVQEGMSSVLLTTKSRRVALVELCFCRPDTPPREPEERDPTALSA